MTARETVLVVEQLSAAFHMAVMQLEDLCACAPAFELLSFPEARRRSCVVVRSPAEGLLVVLGDPYDGALQDWLEVRGSEPGACSVPCSRTVGWSESPKGSCRA